MANASRDENNVPAIIALDAANGTDIVRVEADPTTHALSVDDDTTGTDYGPTNDARDQNNVPTFMAVSSDDGVTPVPIYATASGALLVDSS